VLIERRLFAYVIREDEDSFLSSISFDLKDEDTDDVVDNRKSNL
jgi:hypothetical protein